MGIVVPSASVIFLSCFICLLISSIPSIIVALLTEAKRFEISINKTTENNTNQKNNWLLDIPDFGTKDCGEYNVVFAGFTTPFITLGAVVLLKLSTGDVELLIQII